MNRLSAKVQEFPRFEPPYRESPILELPGGAYPPFNIERFDRDLYRIVLGVAGYVPSEIQVIEADGLLVVRGATDTLRSNGETIRRLIEPSFERRFRLLHGFRVDEWHFRNGLLLIDVARDPATPVASELPPRQVTASEVAMAALAVA
jgi:molecular chaperone IbpA